MAFPKRKLLLPTPMEIIYDAAPFIPLPQIQDPPSRIPVPMIDNQQDEDDFFITVFNIVLEFIPDIVEPTRKRSRIE